MRNDWWIKFLIFLGFRSECCNAKIDYVEEWDRAYCSKCNKRV